MLEQNVDGKYYLSDEKVAGMIAPPRCVKSAEPSEQADEVQQTDTHGICCQQIGAKLGQKGTSFEGYSDVAMTLLARDYKGFGNQNTRSSVKLIDKILQVGNWTKGSKIDNPQRGRVYDPSGISPALTCMGGVIWSHTL